MASTLSEILLAPDARPQVVTDCLALIDQEVSEKSGASGVAIKLAYKTASTFASGYLRGKVDLMLPELAGALQPYWAEFSTAGGSDFGDYLAKRGDEVSESLLAVSDAHGAASERPVIIKAYQTVRNGAAKHIQAALPQLGKMIQKRAG